jgi:AraC-like DNA-binding protein
MTPSTESYDMEGMTPVVASNADDEQQLVETRLKNSNSPATTSNGELVEQITAAMAEETLAEYNSDYSMASAVDQRLLMNIEQYVLQNMSRGQISLEEMSGAMGMGRVPFFHKIRSITTKTPAEVVREIRLKHACTLLVNTNLNLSELAINVGFMTAENFINIFKEKYGMAPLEYRLKNKR